MFKFDNERCQNSCFYFSLFFLRLFPYRLSSLYDVVYGSSQRYSSVCFVHPLPPLVRQWVPGYGLNYPCRLTMLLSRLSKLILIANRHDSPHAPM